MGKLPQLPKEEAEDILKGENTTGAERIQTNNKMPLNKQNSLKTEIETILIPNTSILELKENWGNKLWEAMKQTQKLDEGQHENPPLEEIDFDQKTLEIEIRSEYGDVGSENSKSSKANTLKTLPSY